MREQKEWTAPRDKRSVKIPFDTLVYKDYMKTKFLYTGFERVRLLATGICYCELRFMIDLTRIHNGGWACMRRRLYWLSNYCTQTHANWKSATQQERNIANVNIIRELNWIMGLKSIQLANGRIVANSNSHLTHKWRSRMLLKIHTEQNIYGSDWIHIH
jgi:hypothetical protein